MMDAISTHDVMTPTPNPAAKYYGFWSFAMLALWVLLWTVILPWPAHGFWILLGTYVLADAGSYVLHYYYDHYADPHRSEIAHECQWHLLNPDEITRGPISGILETSALILVPLLFVVAVLTLLGAIPLWLALMLSSLGLIALFSRALHRWSHNRHNHWTIRALQKARLIVTPEAHDKHHQPPHGSNYAIVSGWSNPALDAVGIPSILDSTMARAKIPRRTGYELGEESPPRELQA